MEGRSERALFAVTDLKQYAYCPRIPFYTYCLPLIRPVTFKMEEGKAAHEEEVVRERRRTLALYGLEGGVRHYNVWLESSELGLRGLVDIVIEMEGELIPVEYKQTRREVGRHIWQQVAAYGMMLEEAWHKPVRRGLIFSLLSRRVKEIPITEELRREVWEAVRAMREMVERERMPEPPRRRGKCRNCEFRRFCNDVL